MLWSTKWAYRFLACLGFGVAVSLALAFPYRMHRPDPWAYHYAVHNFARGEFVVSDDRHAYQSLEARALGGHLDQYVQLAEDRWALEKAPGFPLFVVPFYWLGFPRAANVVLSLAATGAIYLFLRQLLDEGAACLGAMLFLFTPANLVALHQGYMDTFASGAFPAIGAGLYFYYMLQRDGPGQASPNTWSRGFSRLLPPKEPALSPPKSSTPTAYLNRIGASPLLLFPAGLFLSWAVVSRPINLYLALLLALHLSLTSLIGLFRDRAIAFDFEPLSDRHSEERSRACPEQSRREESRSTSQERDASRSLP